MDSRDIVTDSEIENAIIDSGYSGRCVGECRLSLVELMLKASAGYSSSHTEESFLSRFGFLKKDRTPNSIGRKFLLSMIYKHSNNKPDIYSLIELHRK